jgi:sugar-specific transcriptional regulator TrmB
MTTMNTKELMELGFNKNEAKVYLSLIKFKNADAHRIIQDTKFHKNIVYDNLDKLIDKGLITFIVEGNKKIFHIASPEILVDIFEEKIKETEKTKEKAKKISNEIKKIAKQSLEKQEATIYRGKQGIRAFYKETLEGTDYVVFGAPQDSIEVMGKTFWKNYDIKRMERKVKARMIFNPSIKNYGKTIVNKLTLVKYFDKDFEPLTETNIQGDKVGIIVWTEEPILFLIKDKNVANSYLKFFEDMWKVAKR